MFHSPFNRAFHPYKSKCLRCFAAVDRYYFAAETYEIRDQWIAFIRKLAMEARATESTAGATAAPLPAASTPSPTVHALLTLDSMKVIYLLR